MELYFMLILLLQLTQQSVSIEIPCRAQLEERVQYGKLFWYKVTESNSLVGLVMKDLHKNTTVPYKHADQQYEIREDFALVFLSESRVKRDEECEIYRCSLWPSVGHSIQESDYRLPQGCRNHMEMEPAQHTADMQMGPVSHVYSLIAVVVLCVVLLGVFLLLSKRKEKYSSVYNDRI